MVALPSVSGYSAVFVCGVYPGFIMKTARSTARFHRIVGESVRSVCQFNVINGVQDGFLYYDSTVPFRPWQQSEIRVLFEYVNCRMSLRMMENGLFDEFKRVRISVTSKILSIIRYLHLRRIRPKNSSLSMTKANLKKSPKVHTPLLNIAYFRPP